MNSHSSYDAYQERLRTAALLSNVSEVLDIDSMFSMPEKASVVRAEQMGAIQTIIHRLATDPEYAAILESLKTADLDEYRMSNVAVSVREFVKASKVPERFVKEFAEAQTLGKAAYYEARDKRDFSIFAPSLERLVTLQREYASLVAPEGNPYDAMLAEYDHGLTQSKLDAVFDRVRERLVPVVRKIYASNGGVAPLTFPSRNKDQTKDQDMALFRELLSEIGFDLSRGTVQESPAGFMIGGNPFDTRIYYREKDIGLMGVISTIMHEGGHGLYEQNLLFSEYGLPRGCYSSIMVHESQSRLYENHVGLSRPFLDRLSEKLSRLYPEDLADVSPDEFYRRANVVAPSKRRTESDELSYHIHVLIRFELERDLINGKISVADLPRLWNEKYRDFLGIEFDHEGEGILQDIHWSDGSF